MGFNIPPSAGAGTGSVTTVSVATANGASGTVANPTTTPAITIAVSATTTAATDFGYRGIPQNLQSTNYTLVLADAGKHIYGATGTNTWTIPANGSVAFGIGTVVTFINGSANAATIAITTDVLTLANSTTTGSRTLAQNGIATAIKVDATHWLISGPGLT